MKYIAYLCLAILVFTYSQRLPTVQPTTSEPVPFSAAAVLSYPDVKTEPLDAPEKQPSETVYSLKSWTGMSRSMKFEL